MPTSDAAVSFARDIKPLFRPIDVLHMKPSGHFLDQYAYMSDPKNNHENAQRVYESLIGNPPKMPPGGPYWTAQQLELYASWMQGGYLP
jgi:hypothetical protein